MKEQYNAPELEIVTFVPMEQLANDYLGGYAKAINGHATKGGASENGDIDIPVVGGDEGTP